MIGEVRIVVRAGAAYVTVDGQPVSANVLMTFKRDGLLSTLKVGQVAPLEQEGRRLGGSEASSSSAPSAPERKP